MKRLALNALLTVAVVAMVAVLIYGFFQEREKWATASIADESGDIDLDTITLEDSGVEVSFSDVILSQQEEQRKLIVSTQEGYITSTLSDRLIESIDWKEMKQTQVVSYYATGYFVVDLDKIVKGDISVDEQNKVVKIYIEHPYLETITVNPQEIQVGDTENGLFTFGDIKMTVDDYVEIEKDIQSRFEKKYNTAENGQEADDNAIKSVTKVYEPLVKAVKKDYSVEVAFK